VPVQTVFFHENRLLEVFASSPKQGGAPPQRAASQGPEFETRRIGVTAVLRRPVEIAHDFVK